MLGLIFEYVNLYLWCQILATFDVNQIWLTTLLFWLCTIVPLIIYQRLLAILVWQLGKRISEWPFALCKIHISIVILIIYQYVLFFFREAIALAKVRLSPLDPALEELYTLWAHQLTKDGNYEQAAKW